MTDTADMVNHPPHYTQNGIECIVAIQASMTPEQFAAFLKGQVIKYLWRFEHKGSPVADLQKAQWYMNRLTDHVESTFASQL